MSFQNLSPLDRTIRILLGLLMLWAGWSGIVETWIWHAALRVFAWVPLVTGILGWCPIYAILGLSTRKPKSSTIKSG
jgi:TRAP-type C4-dicarboxylate transport system permease small subunit